MDYLIIDPSWILAIRTPALNSFFMGFSHYFNFYSYMYVIIIGYWLYPKKKVFKILGFLFPFTVVLNSLIKGFTQIPPPDKSLYLVKVFGAYGFPSGDAMLSALVWFTLFLTLRGKAWRYLCFVPIVLTGFSRVYLGIHSIYDVSGGILLGILVACVFHMDTINSYVKGWFEGKLMSYWLAAASLFGLYMLVYRDLPLDPFIFSFMGMVVGYGLAAPKIKEGYFNSFFPYSLESYMNAAIAAIALYAFVMYTNFTSLTGSPVLNYVLVVLKYTLVNYVIYAIVPWFIKPSSAKYSLNS